MIEDFIDIQKGTVNYKMLAIYNRVEEEFYNPFTLNDEEIKETFTNFGREICELMERHPDERTNLIALLEKLVVPMLNDEVTIDEYKRQAYENCRNEWQEMRREEQNERDFACENGMEPEYWCQKCNVGMCDLH